MKYDIYDRRSITALLPGYLLKIPSKTRILINTVLSTWTAIFPRGFIARPLRLGKQHGGCGAAEYGRLLESPIRGPVLACR